MGFWAWLKRLLHLEDNEDRLLLMPPSEQEGVYVQPQERKERKKPPEPVQTEPSWVPECEFCGQKIGGVGGFRCLTCGEHFCAKHGAHEDHTQTPKKQFGKRIYGKCAECKDKLVELAKTACPYCHKTLCHRHFPKENHLCYPKKRSKKVGTMVSTYADETEVWDTRRSAYVDD